MAAVAGLLAIATRAAAAAAAAVDPGTEVGSCQFETEPVGVGYFWDPSCRMGLLGCAADGVHVECRFCGAGAYFDVPCPASSCKFHNEPFVSYYWDPMCKMGMLGCWADGVHAQCRFCGDYPFTSIDCPEGAAPPNSAACAFEEPPDAPHYWEPGCEMGKHGCNADGVNVHCRFCGKGIFSDIDCPASQVCQFGQDPTAPYFWDPQCKDGMLGCKADGIHQECRFCAKRPFDEVPCPSTVAPPVEVGCTWPLHGEPLVPFFWDPACTMGTKGCWADGIHAECRFCGEDVYGDIPCPAWATKVSHSNSKQHLDREFAWLSATNGPEMVRQAEHADALRVQGNSSEWAEDDWWLANASALHSLSGIYLVIWLFTYA